MEIRTRPVIPAVQHGGGVVGQRLDRYLTVVGGPALSQAEAVEAVDIMEHLTHRDCTTPRKSLHHRPGVTLLAPLKRLRRTLFGGHS